MIFGTTKSKQSDKFNLKELSATATSHRSAGLTIWQQSGLAMLTGLLLAFSCPGFDQWWLAWFMLAPFLVLLTKCRSNSQSLSCGLFFGLGYHLLALRFYAGTHFHINGQAQYGHGYDFWSGQLSLLIWFVQATLLSLPTVAFAWLVNALPLRPGYIPYFQRPFFPYLVSVPLLWIFLHRGLAIASPLAALWQLAPLPPIAIDALPYSQYSQLAIIQSAKFIGSFGVEFLLLLVNAAIASFLMELVKVQDRPVERVDLISPRLGAIMDLAIALGLVGFLSFYGAGEIMHQTFAAGDVTLTGSIGKDYLNSEANQPKIPVGILSGDIFETTPASCAHTLASTAGSCEIIVLPESRQAISFSQSSNVLDLLKKTVRQNRNSVVLSYSFWKEENAARQDFVCMPAGNFYAQRTLLYEKGYSFLHINLLPAPLKEWFFLTDENGLSPLTMAKINWGKIAILGGNEITNPHMVANQVRHGASLIVCESNIDWTTDKSLSKQLLAAAILRAVENNRYVILCAGNAVLAIIEPSGLIRSLYLASSHSNRPDYIEKSGMISSTVQFLWSKTPFTKMWWL